MSVFKRGDTWWYKFWFANKLIRESTKSTSKTLAKEAENQRKRELENGYNGLINVDRARRVMTFSEAADLHLKDYALRHCINSRRYMKQRVGHLQQYFGDLMLVEIREETVTNYQSERLKQGAAGSSINNEVMMLFQIMGKIGDPIC